MSYSSSRIIIAGGSHAVCLGVPQKSAHLKPELVPIDARFDAMTGNFPRDAAYWDELVRVASNRAIAIFWNGNQHYGRFTLAETPPFDLVLPDEPSLPIDPKAVIVPVKRVKEFWQNTYIELAPILEKLKQCEDCRPFLVGTPPPIRDDACIRAALMRNEGFFIKLSNFFKIDLETADLTPRLVMYKLWATIQSSMKDVAEFYQVPFLPVPRAVQADDGFMREEFSQAIDFTHANGFYGAIMRDHINAFVATWG